MGAGSAGSVLAARLSETRQASVLLLEAGVGESTFTDVPILAPALQQTQYVWPYLMEHQPGVCLGKNITPCTFVFQTEKPDIGTVIHGGKEVHGCKD